MTSRLHWRFDRFGTTLVVGFVACLFIVVVVPPWPTWAIVLRCIATYAAAGLFVYGCFTEERET